MSLIDPRIRKQAEVLVDYSAKVKRGEIRFNSKVVQKNGKWLV